MENEIYSYLPSNKLWIDHYWRTDKDRGCIMKYFLHTDLLGGINRSNTHKQKTMHVNTFSSQNAKCYCINVYKEIQSQIQMVIDLLM